MALSVRCGMQRKILPVFGFAGFKIVDIPDLRIHKLTFSDALKNTDQVLKSHATKF